MATTAGDLEPQAAGRRRVLLVEDEASVSQLVQQALDRNGFEVASCATIAQARAVLDREEFDIALVDLILPDGDGLDLVAEVSPTMPTIAVTGRRGSEQDRIRGFELGADDYVTKPFSLRELVARVTAVLRRQALEDERQGRIVYGALEIDLASREVSLEGVPIPLTRMEFDLLVALARRPRRACSREELLEWVWRTSPDAIDQATVTEHVHRVRAKLGEDSEEPRHIVTVRGVGYRFDP